jgi:hypothetical protein
MRTDLFVQRLAVLTLAALLFPVQALAGQEDAGKILFSTAPIGLGKNKPGKLATSFKFGQPIYWRVYAERSGAGQASLEGRECSFDREVSPARAFIVELDGRVLNKSYPTFMGTKISKKEWNTETSWSEPHGFNAPVDTHEISFNADFVGRVAGDLTPGTHQLVIKAVVECDDERPRFISKPMAEGKLTLEVTAANVASATAPQASLPAAARKDPKISSEAIKIMNSYWKQHGSSQRALKAVIVDKDWTLERNDLTGIVIARSIDTALAYQKDDGCHFYSVRLRQDAEGKRGFGETYLGSEGASDEDIACAKVK